MSPRRQVLTAVVAAWFLGLAGCSTDSVLELQVGDCLDSRSLEVGEVSSATQVDCSEEHDAEVFAEHTFGGEDYPGMDLVAEESDAACREAFADFIGVPYEESEIDFSVLSPTQQSWDQADDRTTLCIALTDEPTTGSLEGAQI